MSDPCNCACVSRYARECFRRRHYRPWDDMDDMDDGLIGERCECSCHDQSEDDLYDDDYDPGRDM